MSASRVIGRPRSEKSREAILDAAFRLLIDRGYLGFTVEGVAAAAGAGKTTLYRWWKTKAELAVDSFMHATTDELTMPDTGTASADFRLQIAALGSLLRDGRGQALAAMLGGSRNDPELARSLGERWLEPRRKWGLQRIMRAQSDGQLRRGIQPTAALAVLYGPLYTPLLFGGDVPSVDAVEAYLDVACHGIFVAPLL